MAKILVMMLFSHIKNPLSLHKLLHNKVLLLCMICLALCGCSQVDNIKQIENQNLNLKSFKFHVQEEINQFVIRVYTYEQNDRHTVFEKVYKCKDAKNQMNFQLNSSFPEDDSIMFYSGKADENEEGKVSPVVIEKTSIDSSYSINQGSSAILTENEIKENEEIPIYVKCIFHSKSDFGASLQHFYHTPRFSKDDFMYIITIEFIK